MPPPKRDQIETWWKKHPGASIGIATGTESGIVVLDVDPRHGGQESLERLLQGQEIKTLASATGGRGWHYYFKHAGHQVRCSAGKIGAGLDIKGDGGYVIGAPSLHQSGGTYRWINDLPIAPLPDWLLEAIGSSEKAVSVKEVLPVGASNGQVPKIKPSLLQALYQPRRPSFPSHLPELCIWIEK